MVIKAYHYVQVGAIETVKSLGEILPASERIDPSLFIWDCQNMVDEFRSDLHEEVDEMAVDALLDWVDAEIYSLEDWQRSIGSGEVQRESQFLCVDLLAGDLDRVFLSVGDWVEWVPARTGFVFDAQKLVRKGAGLRVKDLSVEYGDALKEILSRRWKSEERAREALEAALRKALKKNTLKGTEALRWLRKAGPSAEGVPEIVWEGSLPLKWATEVWAEGRRVA